ncbi:MAG: MBL fold metallo-hydrolase [bacterium]|nr:MAG: MBL fold metallo-hydrolase [bacterium]
MKILYLNIIIVQISILLIGASPSSAGKPQAIHDSEEGWIEGIGNPKVTRLSDNVLAITGLYHTGGENGVTAGIIFTRESVIFIDAGMTIDSAEFIWNEARKYIGNRKMFYLILTHHHSDHIFGMRVFKEKGAKVISHSWLKSFISMRGEQYKKFLLNMLKWSTDKGDRIFGDVVLSVPDQVIEKDTILTIDDEEIHILYTPGHVSTEISIYHPHSKTLFAGDTVYEGMELTTHFGGPDEWRLWIAQLERLKELDLETICPGHGSLCTKEELDRNIDFLRKKLH